MKYLLISILFLLPIVSNAGDYAIIEVVYQGSSPEIVVVGSDLKSRTYKLKDFTHKNIEDNNLELIEKMEELDEMGYSLVSTATTTTSIKYTFYRK